MARFSVPGRPLNLATRFLDHNLDAGRGQKTALIVDDPEHGVSRYTYQQVAERANQFGWWMRSEDLGMEDRVFIILPDGFDWVGAFFGALKIGCTVMFLNPRVSADEIAFYLEDSRARAVITTSEIASSLPTKRPFLKAVVPIDNARFRESLKEQPVTLEAAPTLEEDFAVWLYSSGSTGAPKAAVHRAYDFVYNTERYAKDVLQITEADVTLSVPKLFFGYATGSNLLFPFFFGGTAILFPDKPTPERLFSMTEKHRATMLVNVPTMIAQMAAAYESADQKPDTSSLRVLTSAGEALPVELYRRWKAATDVEILDGIGSAEMFHVFISAKFGDVKPGSLGTLVDGYRARIVGDDGQDCGPAEIGTLWIEGGSAAAFYWQRHEKSRDVLRGHWVVTGDKFERDEDGHYYYRGRADDLMKVAGRWVAPQEIEDVLVQHESVLEAAVSGFESEGLVKPMAFVVLQEGVKASAELASALSDTVAERLLPFKAPRFVEFVQDLPRGDRDKIDRKQLKQDAAAAASARS